MKVAYELKLLNIRVSNTSWKNQAFTNLPGIHKPMLHISSMPINSALLFQKLNKVDVPTYGAKVGSAAWNTEILARVGLLVRLIILSNQHNSWRVERTIFLLLPRSKKAVSPMEMSMWKHIWTVQQMRNHIRQIDPKMDMLKLRWLRIA